MSDHSIYLLGNGNQEDFSKSGNNYSVPVSSLIVWRIPLADESTALMRTKAFLWTQNMVKGMIRKETREELERKMDT